MESWKLKSRNEQNNTSQNMFHASLLLLEYNNGQRKEAEPSQQVNILQQVNRVCLRSDHLKPPKNVLFQEDTKYFMNICWAPNFEGHAVGNQSALTRPGLVSSKSLPNRGFQRNTMIQWCTVGTVHVPCLYNLYIYIIQCVSWQISEYIRQLSKYSCQLLRPGFRSTPIVRKFWRRKREQMKRRDLQVDG